jgi:hypothetical protein
MRRLPFLLLLLLLPLAWAIHRWGQEWLVAPLAERIWGFYLTLQMLPQEATWMGLLVIAGINIIRLLMTASPWKPTPTTSDPTQKRLRQWVEMLQAAGESGYWGKHLTKEVRKLVATDWAYRMGRSPDEVMTQIWHGRIPLSPPVQDFLGPRPTTAENPTAALQVIEEIVGELEVGSG